MNNCTSSKWVYKGFHLRTTTMQQKKSRQTMVKYKKLGMFQQGYNLVFNHGMEKRVEGSGLGHVLH